jgi:hypothetical protein
MIPIREETTLASLMDRSFRRNQQLEDPSVTFVALEESAKQFKDLVNSGERAEPARVGLLMGRLLSQIFDIMDNLSLDPAGCMILADSEL